MEKKFRIERSEFKGHPVITIFETNEEGKEYRVITFGDRKLEALLAVLPSLQRTKLVEKTLEKKKATKTKAKTKKAIAKESNDLDAVKAQIAQLADIVSQIAS
ncbi:MAG: hypothetical protein ACO2ZP_00540 [Bacteriovoracaceae bacterium]